MSYCEPPSIAAITSDYFLADYNSTMGNYDDFFYDYKNGGGEELTKHRWLPLYDFLDTEIFRIFNRIRTDLQLWLDSSIDSVSVSDRFAFMNTA